MARLINLGVPEPSNLGGVHAEVDGDILMPSSYVAGEEEQIDPNMGLFSEALTCYPIVTQFARYLDLNSLHELSRTCRRFRFNMLQYRCALIEHTLRCANEKTDPAQKLGHALFASHQIWTTYGRDGVKIGRVTGGQVGTCARDLVGGCRRCGEVVCRNCIIKSPTSTALKGRLRRLCRTCMKCPLRHLTTRLRVRNDSEHTSVWHEPCQCPDTVWICKPCGQSTRTNDTTYMRGWAWRTRYGACGGIGAGLGEGNEGVECGHSHHHRSACLAARPVEHEIECDPSEMAAIEADMAQAELSGHHWEGSSYIIQETIGIGGVVKKKVKKAIHVGAIVKEYEDERVTGKFLLKEQSDANRAWCSWCERVVLGRKDTEKPTASSDSIASTDLVSSN